MPRGSRQPPGHDGHDLTMTSSSFDQRCPYCRHLLRDAQRVDEGDPAEAPAPGAVAICPYCTKTAMFDENVKLRKVTDAELAELQRSRSYLLLRTLVRRNAQERGSYTPPPDGEGEDLDMLEIPVAFTADGAIDLEQMPTELQEILRPILRQIRITLVGEDIKHNVTAEVANHVLSAYGNEQASMPSVTVGALISLIRLCNESDDYLLDKLNNTEGIHGYVLAVTLLAEFGPEGLEILETVAGLRTPSKNGTK